MPRHKHPNHADKYTPITPEILGLLEQLKVRHGTWRAVAYHVDTRQRILRFIRTGQRKCISMTLLDRMLTSAGVGSIDDYVWFTPEDLITMGIWDPIQYVEGKNRIRGNADFYADFGNEKREGGDDEEC